MRTYFFLAIFTILSLVKYNISFAAFPIKTSNAVVSNKGYDSTGHGLSSIIAHPQQTEDDDASSEGTGTYGIVSFVSALAAPLFLFIPFIGFMAFFAAVAAIVFGAMGLNKPNHGLAVAGMILGIGEIVAAILVFVLVIALLGAFL